MKLKTPELPELLGLILFGSVARGDADVNSDRDLCAIVEDLPFDSVVDFRFRLSKELQEPAESLAVYTYSAFSDACAKGSLFLEHLKLEGEILFDRLGIIGKMLGELVTFASYAEELELYRRLLADTRTSLAVRGQLDPFDLHVLHGIVRDACIMITYKLGSPAFGRESAFRAAKASIPGLPLSSRVHEILAEGHLAYTRTWSTSRPRPAGSEAGVILDEVDALMALCSAVTL